MIKTVSVSYLENSTRLLNSIIHVIVIHKWASTQENLPSGFENNKGADQPALPRSLISASVIIGNCHIKTCYKRSEILIFLLVSVAEQAGLSMARSETPKTEFLRTRPKYLVK